MKIRPLQNALVVRPDVEKHELFILLRQKKAGTGIIVFAGPDCIETKVGDKIIFGDRIGEEVNWEGEDMLVMREEHILGVLE